MVSKSIRSLIQMHPHLWIAAQKNCADIPPPSVVTSSGNYSYSAYALFIFGGGPCTWCSKRTDTLPCSWVFRFRACSTQKYDDSIWGKWLPRLQITLENGEQLYVYSTRQLKYAKREQQEAFRIDRGNSERDPIGFRRRNWKQLREEHLRREESRPAIHKNEIDLKVWRKRYKEQVAVVRSRNIKFVKLMSAVDDVNFRGLLRCPALKCIFAAFNRDLTFLTHTVWMHNRSAILTEFKYMKNGVFPDGMVARQSDKLRCSYCPRLITVKGMADHIVDKHKGQNPDEIPFISKAKGDKKHCPDCPDSKRVFTKRGLEDHRLVKRVNVLGFSVLELTRILDIRQRPNYSCDSGSGIFSICVILPPTLYMPQLADVALELDMQCTLNQMGFSRSANPARAIDALFLFATPSCCWTAICAFVPAGLEGRIWQVISYEASDSILRKQNFPVQGSCLVTLPVGDKPSPSNVTSPRSPPLAVSNTPYCSRCFRRTMMPDDGREGLAAAAMDICFAISSPFEGYSREASWTPVLPMNTDTEAVKAARKWGYMPAAQRQENPHGRSYHLERRDDFHGRTLGVVGLLACQHEGVRPEVVLLGKALSGGVYPVPAVLVDKDVMLCIWSGEHGRIPSPVPSCAVSITTLQMLLDENLSARAARLGEIFRTATDHSQSPLIQSVRGLGLLDEEQCNAARRVRGLDVEGLKRRPAWQSCLLLKERGVLAKTTHGNVLCLTRKCPIILRNEARPAALLSKFVFVPALIALFAPPLVIEEVDLLKAVKIIG
ncbi:hypothetical protein C8R45DRAFT_926536 [Mycena sanguinolenta]|nr:hypothetical protein C8R45DRAFT_926536 [Mycena sanguinolenta]